MQTSAVSVGIDTDAYLSTTEYSSTVSRWWVIWFIGIGNVDLCKCLVNPIRLITMPERNVEVRQTLSTASLWQLDLIARRYVRF